MLLDIIPLLTETFFPSSELDDGTENKYQYYISFHIANTFVSTHWNGRLPCCILSMFHVFDCHHHIVLLRQKRLCYWSALPELPLITLHYLSRWMLVTVLIVDVRKPYWTNS